jgi:hypothetical protein
LCVRVASQYTWCWTSVRNGSSTAHPSFLAKEQFTKVSAIHNRFSRVVYVLSHSFHATFPRFQPHSHITTALHPIPWHHFPLAPRRSTPSLCSATPIPITKPTIPLPSFHQNYTTPHRHSNPHNTSPLSQHFASSTAPNYTEKTIAILSTRVDPNLVALAGLIVVMIGVYKFIELCFDETHT